MNEISRRVHCIEMAYKHSKNIPEVVEKALLRQWILLEQQLNDDQPDNAEIIIEPNMRFTIVQKNKLLN